MKRLTPDLLVIGAGSGGLSVAAGAAQMGADVILLEGHRMGGDCLNYGCVPSKALLSAARRAAVLRQGAAPGTGGDPVAEYTAAMAHVAEVIARIAPHDSVERFESLGVRVIRAWGRFISPREVVAGDHVIRPRRVVIATGAAPLVPDIPGLAEVPYLTNETLFDLRHPPEHLLIAGGGPVGLEMAQAHLRLGVPVTVIEGDRLLGREDPELAALLSDRLRAEGAEIVEAARIARVAGTAGDIHVETEAGATYGGSHLLLALGRRARTDGLGLEAAGITANGRGIRTDARLRTGNRRVYAIGDVTGGAQFTHVAGYQAGVVLRAALFALPSRARSDHIPRVTYTDPEIAQVGMTEAEARAAHGARLEVHRVDLAQNDRAVAEGLGPGMIKLMAVRGRPVGVSIAGPQAGELIGIWALALARGMKLSAIAGLVLPYPTLGELNKRVAGAYFSARLFDNETVKRLVRAVQHMLP
ncbi:dihydrolipoyl dehydrogenase family protein [Pseudodonghicola flavimaris]|uniref:FAD-dependent oxidoreductase n=1 Tax=Pseudodonghicola flavimaris TaxID=3050036 RepID=A0ABT7EW55_9RHOB|nr:FAD-dependent oxidoreductase [Pseudodonghicola flavimaris]MDK3016584.1 FAD-dependent oxidoreductase [Pseudodonghicola flavimaris]